ncbi:MAG: hypothetical protein QGG23_00145 [Candidatus Bathyarchaeota archaeon]|nr:hypothetical protein [Candidatus Bathyarchaeota archaeon]
MDSTFIGVRQTGEWVKPKHEKRKRYGDHYFAVYFETSKVAAWAVLGARIIQGH